MAKVYARVNDIIKAIEIDVNNGARLLAEATKNYLYDTTMENLYEEMDSGKYYDRLAEQVDGSGSVLESISMSFVSSANSYRIMFDGRKIAVKRAYNKETGEGKKGNFNAHADFDFNKIARNDLIEWIEEGHKVPNKAEKRPGAHMIRDTKQWLRNKISAIASKSGDSFSDVLKRMIKV